MLIDWSKYNFTKSEFACKGTKCCGGSAPINKVLVESLQKLRESLGRPIFVTSGFRCHIHNLAVDGSINSKHCQGLAADIKSTCSTKELLDEIKKIPEFINGGIGVYDNFIHVDVRGHLSRW